MSTTAQNLIEISNFRSISKKDILFSAFLVEERIRCQQVTFPKTERIKNISIKSEALHRRPAVLVLHFVFTRAT
jgi:hypothetical protein